MILKNACYIRRQDNKSSNFFSETRTIFILETKVNFPSLHFHKNMVSFNKISLWKTKPKQYFPSTPPRESTQVDILGILGAPWEF